VKVGLIGCGGIAPAHLLAYRKFQGLEVVGLCDLDLEKAKNLAAKFKIEKTFQVQNKRRFDRLSWSD